MHPFPCSFSAQQHAGFPAPAFHQLVSIHCSLGISLHNIRYHDYYHNIFTSIFVLVKTSLLQSFCVYRYRDRSLSFPTRPHVISFTYICTASHRFDYRRLFTDNRVTYGCRIGPLSSWQFPTRLTVVRRFEIAAVIMPQYSRSCLWFRQQTILPVIRPSFRLFFVG